MALEPRYLSALRRALSDLLSEEAIGGLGDGLTDCADRRAHDAADRLLLRATELSLRLPCEIGDYTDFLTSLPHTERHGRFKGLVEPVPAAFKHLPVAYHGRASSIRVSGVDVVRPHGQYRAAGGEVCFGPAPALDFELELAALIGRGNPLGEPIHIDRAGAHVFGYCLLNDWSAKSIQWFEQVLGPFLGKSFHSSLSPWVVTQEALAPFRIPPQPRALDDPPLLPYLRSDADAAEGSLSIELEARLSTAWMRESGVPEVGITHTRLDNLYWTFAQMIAHHTSNGCNLRTGDLLGSGTISGVAGESRACLTELTNAGRDPLRLPNGQSRLALEDADEIILTARAARPGAITIGFGECRGRILPARPWNHDPDTAAEA